MITLKSVRLNETKFLSEEAAKNCGTYWGLYIFNPAEVTFCCEITPSHWLECVGFDTELKVYAQLYEELGAGLHDSSHYRHARAIESLNCKDLGEFETFEEGVESARCNYGGL